MSHAPRICVDLRRAIDCGVGRIAFDICTVLSTLADEFCLVLLLSPSTKHLASCFPSAASLVDSAPFLSSEDLIGLPTRIERYCDAFWASHYFVSPKFRCPLIVTVHDGWAIKNQEWLPNHDEVAEHHGADVLVTLEASVRSSASDNSVWPKLVKEAFQCRPSVFDRYILSAFIASVKAALAVVTVSEFSRAEVVSIAPDIAHKLYIVPPTIRGWPPTERKQLSYPLRMLTVGKLDPRKNYPFLLTSLKCLTNIAPEVRWSIDIVGDIGYRSYGKAIIERCKALGLADRCRFRGSIADDQLLALYHNATALLLTSRHEGFGLPLLEALEVGLPAIVSDVGALPEVGLEFVQYSDADQPEAFARCIVNMLHSYDNRLAVARQGRQHVTTKYSVSNAAVAIRRVLRAVL